MATLLFVPGKEWGRGGGLHSPLGTVSGFVGFDPRKGTGGGTSVVIVSLHVACLFRTHPTSMEPECEDCFPVRFDVVSRTGSLMLVHAMSHGSRLVQMPWRFPELFWHVLVGNLA